ncbi:MAG: hypothetical protein HYY18_17255 [Planctomycetes bacterium]|nr:hypothetical protein [Planctomycetota bacterium]
MPWRLFLLSFAAYAAVAVATGEFLVEADSDSRLLGARYAIEHPSFMLDPWHKPVLTTLIVIVLKLGGGTVALKMIQAALAAAALVLMRAASIRAGAEPRHALAAAALAGLAPFWVREIVSLLTEISCALFLSAALLLWFREKFALAALCVSASFLARFEGLFYALAFLPFLFQKRSWAGIALLGAAPLAWHLAGWAATGDPKFLFHRQPHPWGHSLYGSGPPWTYVKLLPVATGFLLIPALLGLKKCPRLPLAVAGVVLAGHTVLWTAGILGAYGMSRYLVTLIPALAVAAAFGFERLPRGPRIALFAAAAPVALGIVLYRPNTFEGARLLAAEKNVLTDHPTVARFSGPRWRRIDEWKTAPPGQRIAWESSFGDDGAFREIPKERLILVRELRMEAKWPWERSWTGRVYELRQ